MLVLQQVWQYCQALHSRFHPTVLVPASDWPLEAARQTRCQFVQWLADQVARDLMTRCPLRVSDSELAESVSESRTGDLQHAAEHFLESHYYGYPSSDPHFFKLLRIFRRLIQKKLRRTSLNKNRLHSSGDIA